MAIRRDAAAGPATPVDLILGGRTMRILERLGLQRAPNPGPSLGGKTIRVGPGDTLRSIARREYGDEAMWDRILEANQARVKDAESLNLGTELRLP